jgi:hypothetical protein
MDYQNNYQNNHNDGAMDWNEEIVKDSEFVTLPEGIYDFIIKKPFERQKTSGQGKLPVCNMAVITLTINYEGKEVDVSTKLVLHRSIEWKISQFFEAIGLKRKGEPCRMAWNEIIGKTGKAKIAPREYNGNTYNDVKEFIVPSLDNIQSQPNQWGNWSK